MLEKLHIFPSSFPPSLPPSLLPYLSASPSTRTPACPRPQHENRVCPENEADYATSTRTQESLYRIEEGGREGRREGEREGS